MKKTLTCFIVLFIFLGNITYSQDPYTLTVLSAEYNNVEENTFLITDQPWDDFDNQEFDFFIGFDFMLFDTIIDKLYIGSYFAEMIENPGVGHNFYNLLIPCFGNFISIIDENTGAVLTRLSYSVEGEVGTRVLKQEWQNVGFKNDGEGGSFVNFQCWIYEEDGTIEFHYGPYALTSSLFALYEDSGPSVGLINNYDVAGTQTYETGLYLSGNASNPSLETFHDTNQNNTPVLIGQPAEGTVYRFTRTEPDAVNVTPKVLPLDIFPTLVEDKLTLKNVAVLANKKYQITDLAGRIIIPETILERKTINLSFLQSGMYFINLFDEGKVVKMGKFIKQ